MIKPAVEVKNVYKNFSLPTGGADSVKSLFINPFSLSTRENHQVQRALHDITFTINEGEFFGIVGRNGSGKSTLLKIIAGIYQPTKGSVKHHGRLVPFIELGVGFNPELTGRENVYLNGALMGFSEKQVDGRYDEIVKFSELERFMDQKLKNYSSGMQVRLAFSVATILAESDILLIDEVLAVGDSAFQKKCFAYFRKLKEEKKTVIFVSHDMNAVQEYCDRAVLVEDSELILEGTPAKIAAAYIRMFADEQASSKEELKKNKGRWGTEAVKYESVRLSHKRITNQETITISADAKCHADVNGEVILGFKVKDSEGKALVGTNTKIKEKNVHLKMSESIKVEWTLPLIFNDGHYYVDLDIEAENYTHTYDHWEDAGHFVVERNEQSSYAINPIIETHISNKKAK